LPPPFAQIPRHPLLYPHPSPIHPLPALTKHLLPTPSPITLHAKREDQASPLASAGNKYRKLEYLVPDILSPTPQYGGVGPSPERGSAPAPAAGPNTNTTTTRPTKPTTLVTEGALQSNHTVQVAALATHLGLDAVLLLHKTTGGAWRAAPDPRAFTRTGNVQIARLLGADIRMLDSANVAAATPQPRNEAAEPRTKNADADADASPAADEEDGIAAILHTLRTQDGKTPYWIPSGASLHPLGGLGYARCAFEIAAQEEEEDAALSHGRYDYIFVACGSGSTLGGLIAGFKLLEKIQGCSQATAAGQQRPPRKIIGVLTSPTSPKAYHEARVLRFARQAAGRIGLDAQREVTAADVTLEDRFVGAGYGVLDAETKRTMDVMARTEAVVLDPVYTAKVARAMMHWVGTGELAEDWRRRRTDTGTGKTAEEPDDSVNVLFIHTGGQSALSAYAD
ncbi:tryptophan synthase beta subunit-like PLP-dependent enzyme, partial [Aspergillus indologenus CBS 114.80]